MLAAGNSQLYAEHKSSQSENVQTTETSGLSAMNSRTKEILGDSKSEILDRKAPAINGAAPKRRTFEVETQLYASEQRIYFSASACDALEV